MKPSSFESAIRLQFDCLIRKVIDRTVKNYYRNFWQTGKTWNPVLWCNRNGSEPCRCHRWIFCWILCISCLWHRNPRLWWASLQSDSEIKRQAEKHYFDVLFPWYVRYGNRRNYWNFKMFRLQRKNEGIEHYTRKLYGGVTQMKQVKDVRDLRLSAWLPMATTKP